MILSKGAEKFEQRVIINIIDLQLSMVYLSKNLQFSDYISECRLFVQIQLLWM